jgi:hypothetical protein
MNDKDILDKLQELSNKWQWAHREAHDICKEAIYEIRLLRELRRIRHEYGSQRFSEGAD